MTKRVLISGSVAYDSIMVFDGHFKDHILPEKIHMLNVSFLTLEMRKEYGGTAANIAYNLKLLGGDPFVLASIGKDGTDYLARMQGWGIDCTGVRQFPETFTAQAFITTDLSANQITAFHPGAMGHAHEIHASTGGPAAYGLISPNGKAAMIGHAAQYKALGIPYLFDPGQGLPMFDGAELRDLISNAHAVTVNDYEAQMLSDKTGWTTEAIAAKVKAFVITLGADGSRVYEDGSVTDISCAKASAVVDPTGCGDAFRAGLLFGLTNQWSWVDSARLGGVIGAIKIAHAGAQNHRFDWAQVASIYQQSYGTKLPSA